MRAAELTLGRRFALVLDPGEELLGTVARFCAEHGIRQAIVPGFFGAFRDVELIATRGPLDDDEAPLQDRVSVAYVEGSGSGSIARRDDGMIVHLHAAVGVKRTGGEAVAGHVLAATAHPVELFVDEVLAPVLRQEPKAESAGLYCLDFADA